MLTEAKPQHSYSPIGERRVIAFAQKEAEMQLLRKLQADFYARLNITEASYDILNRSFNAVTDRWHIEVLRKRGDTEGLIAFRDEMRLNHKTDLMERFHAAESHGTLLIRDRHLYSAEFPEIPFSDVLRRGAEYRAAHGSREKEREGELGEVAGWDIINHTFSDPNAPVGTKFVSFSTPSLVRDGAYKGKFVDEYTLVEDEAGNRQVKRSRVSVNWNDTEYKNAAISIDPHFFIGYDGRPLDAWFLSHPLRVDKAVTPVPGNGLSKEDFNYIYADAITQKLLSQYEELMYAQEVDWLEVALITNAIRNHADDLKNGLLQGVRVKAYKDDFDELRFQAYRYKKGVQQVQTVGGGGCPPNKGIQLGGVFGSSGNNAGIEIYSNSVAKFLNGEDQEWFNCPKCKYKATGPIGDNPCPGCSLTKEEAAEEGAIMCD